MEKILITKPLKLNQNINIHTPSTTEKKDLS